MKKGFTLIELLAVIVILAIIAVIASPIVLGIINDSKESANIRSIDMYKKAVENAIASYKLSFPEDTNIKAYKLYKKYNGKKDFIEYDGTDIDCDIQIYSTGEVYITNCTIDGKEVLAEDSTKENKKYYSVGTETIETHIGEYVNYVATGAPNENVKWRILGVENGKVLLLSDSIGELTLGDSNNREESKIDYLTAEQQLNDFCAPYGNGTKATSVRSIKVEDVDRLTGFDPYMTGDYTIFRAGRTSEYGNVVTYSNQNGKIYYSGNNGVKGIEDEYTNFDSVDGVNISSTNPNNTLSYTSNYYWYHIRTLRAQNNTTTPGETLGLEEGSKSYIMIGAGEDYIIANKPSEKKYWLANQDICASESRVSYQIRIMWGATVNAATVYNSFESKDATTAHVRAVVTLDSSAKLVYDKENSIWNIE